MQTTDTPHFPRRARVLLLAGLAVVLGGCGIFSPDEVDEGKKQLEPFPPATTQDVLISNLARAYAERNFEEYAKLLDPDFQFFFAESDVQDLGLSEPFWVRSEDLRATEAMFSGQPGSGGSQPPIQSLDIQLTAESPSWSTEVPPQFAGTTLRVFRVDMTVNYEGGATDQVRGLQEFYAAEHVENGQVIYKLKFWRDLGTDVGGVP